LLLLFVVVVVVVVVCCCCLRFFVILIAKSMLMTRLRDQLKVIIDDEIMNQKNLLELGIRQFIRDELCSNLACSVCGYDCFISCIH
jgi:hypothetical protein